MARNFGISKETMRPVLGGNEQLAAPHPHDAIQPRGNVIRLFADLPAERASCRQPNSRADDFNVGAGFLFLAAVLLPWVIVGGIVVGYLAIAPQPVEYQGRVEAYRFKGH